MKEALRIPVVEIYETVEGEGTQAGFPTIFVRLFGCNLRCVWCDTPYSYPPGRAEKVMTVAEILDSVRSYPSTHLCLTGGEPLMLGESSLELLDALSDLEKLEDIHVETNGAIDLAPFLDRIHSPKVRYVMDFKLPDSEEMDRMVMGNLSLLRASDELKFVIASEADFHTARELLAANDVKAVPLFSPVWETMPPSKLAELMLEYSLSGVRLNLQLHKLIWDPSARGV